MGSIKPNNGGIKMCKAEDFTCNPECAERLQWYEDKRQEAYKDYLRDHEYMVKLWNMSYPVGTKVVVIDDLGNPFEDITDGPAIMFGDEAMAYIKSKGAYRLTRITPLEEIKNDT